MDVKLIAYTGWTGADADELPNAFYDAEHPLDDEHIVEFAGRVCYKSTDKLGSEDGWIRGRVEAGHESIIEHMSFTFLIDGISRVCSHQLVRHRLASYSQESLRYVEVPSSDKDAISNLETIAGYVCYPPSVEDNNDALDLMDRAYDNAFFYYHQLVHRLGVPKEDARFVLPMGTATRIVVTMNARELRHFCKVRMNPAAQWEIRELARIMLNKAWAVAPRIFGDLVDNALKKGESE